MKLLSLFRVVAFLEGCSFLLLFVTMYLKYRMAVPGPNYAVGMAHGVLFIAYAALLFPVSSQTKWGWRNTGLAFLASLFPFGTFIAEAKLFNKAAKG